MGATSNVVDITRVIEEPKMEADRLDKIGRVANTGALQCGFDYIETTKLIKKNLGHLIVVGARPGAGKTVFGCQLAFNVAQNGGNALILSLEMAKEEIKERLMAYKAERTCDHIKEMTDTNYNSLNSDVQDVNLFINDEPCVNINKMVNIIRDINNIKKLDVIVVDYLQIITTSTGMNLAEKIKDCMLKLKKIAKETLTPIVILAQMNRKIEDKMSSEKNNHVRPGMGDIADGSEAEKTADVLMFIHRPYQFDRSYSPKLTYMCVVKNRHGASEDFELIFEGDKMRFRDKEEF